LDQAIRVAELGEIPEITLRRAKMFVAFLNGKPERVVSARKRPKK
jgi:hypothetical protein